MVRKKEKRVIRKLCLWLAAGGMAIGLACQPTPETEFIVNRGDNLAEKRIEETPAPTGSGTDQPLPTFAVPERWTDEIKTKYITVQIDAEVITSGQTVFPVRTVKRTGFTKEMMQPIMDAMFPDVIAYREGTGLSEEDYDEAIRRAMGLGKTKRARELNWDKQQATATDAEFIETNHIECTDEPLQITLLTAKGQKMKASATANGLLLSRRNTGIVYVKTDVEDGVLLFGDEEEESEEMTTVIPSLSSEQAREQAEAFLRGVNIEGFSLCKQEEACYFDLEGNAIWSTGWYLQYVRNYEYYPLDVKYYDGATSGFLSYANIPTYNAGMGNESIKIYVSEQGVEDFAWVYPYAVQEVVNEDVRLMPFEEMKDILKRSISVGVAYLKERTGYELRVEQLILTLSVQRVRDEKELAYLMPTWVCMIGVYDKDLPGSQKCAGVIAYGFNAIDGTRVKMSGE